MLVQFDPTERQQIRDQSPHPVRLGRHDVQEAVARDHIFTRVALQSLDEAAERG